MVKKGDPGTEGLTGPPGERGSNGSDGTPGSAGPQGKCHKIEGELTNEEGQKYDKLLFKRGTGIGTEMRLIPTLYLSNCPPGKESENECSTWKDETTLTLTDHRQIQKEATALCLHHEESRIGGSRSNRIAFYGCMGTTQQWIFRKFSEFLEAGDSEAVPVEMMVNLASGNCLL